MAQLSPMMAQYFEIKKKHKDEIVFFRLAIFTRCSTMTQFLRPRNWKLTLTGRDCGQEERAPMCGVPFHSYENYVAKLIAKGYKVAICEQMEDPATAKGLVKRDIIRVITPGTVIESSMLQDDKNNYIGSIYLKNGCIGVCFADVSTGSAHTTELAGEKLSTQLIAELCRYNPSELLFNTALLDFKDVTAYIKQHMTCSVELMEDECYAPDEVERLLTEQFGTDWPKATGLGREGNAHAALSALLGYLHRTQKKGVERLKLVHSYAEAQYMQLSPVTRANLELTETMRGREKRGTLLWVLDKTQTAMGKRLLRSWLEQPLVSSAAINRRLNCVQALYSENIQRAELSGGIVPCVRYGAPDDPHGVWLRHPQGNLRAGQHLHPAAPDPGTGFRLQLSGAGCACAADRSAGGYPGPDFCSDGRGNACHIEGWRRDQAGLQCRGGRAA